MSRALALPLFIPLLYTLFLFSFQTLSSPAVAAGEEAPSFKWPARGEVVQPFRAARGSYGAGGHAGIDIFLPVGSAVRASAPGTVSFAGGTPVGICVSLLHAGDFKTTYVALRRVVVRKGQHVEAGQLLGESDGAMDRSTPLPHLHFGLFLKGVAVDPLPYLLGKWLHPSRSLFLGPWEDRKAIDAYFQRHGGGGVGEWLKDGVDYLARAAKDGLHYVARAARVVGAAAWRVACGAARALWRGLSYFYRTCIRPWAYPLYRGLARAAKAVLSNRFVQAVLAGLAAALLICAAVVGIGFALGLSLATIVVAAVAGSAAALGYSVYYAFAAGDSFTFGGCFLNALAVGGAAAGACMLFQYLAPIMGSGFAKLGMLGFCKAFFAHGAANAAVYTLFCVAGGRKLSPWAVLASFVIGGLSGSLGKLVVSGLFSQATAQGLAAGFLTSGGSLLGGEGLAQAGLYAGSLLSNLSQKLSSMFLCGCIGFLGDVVVRGLAGGRPSVLESCLSFVGGFLAGGMGLLARGEGVAGVLSHMSGGRWKVSSELGKALVSKFFTTGAKEGAGILLRRAGEARRRSRESLRWLYAGGE
ncbi:MAG: M23 family metallopeptidase [Actinobacteria bacterium]|nr:M23 family metallopeptidase [Actinomycetota bacterium]